MAFTPHFARNGFASLAAAGTNQATAAAIANDITNVTGADGTKGVKLPTPKSGQEHEPLVVINAEAAQNLKIYPHSGGKINGGSTNAAITISGGVTMRLDPASATEWYTETQNLSGSQAAGAAGTVEASKAVVVDANKDIGDFRNLDVVNLDAGASGVAGSVDIFPTTASKGKLTLTKSDNTNNDTTTINVAAHGQATTITVPDGGQAAASVVLTEGAQTLNGTKTIPALVTTNLDAGASGTAGTVDVFPTTALKGKLSLTKSDNTNDDTTTINVAGQAAAQTLTVPDPLASADFILGSQAAVARTATVDGTGTGTIADKGCLQKITVTAGGDANSIIVLPTPTPGTIVILYVGATGFELRTSDPATIGINGGTGAGAESAIPANTTAIMYCESATSWKGLQMGSDGTLAKVEVAA